MHVMLENVENEGGKKKQLEPAIILSTLEKPLATFLYVFQTFLST